MRHNLWCMWKATGVYQELALEAPSRAAARRLAERSGLKIMGEDPVSPDASGREEGPPGATTKRTRASAARA